MKYPVRSVLPLETALMFGLSNLNAARTLLAGSWKLALGFALVILFPLEYLFHLAGSGQIAIRMAGGFLLPRLIVGLALIFPLSGMRLFRSFLVAQGVPEYSGAMSLVLYSLGRTLARTLLLILLLYPLHRCVLTELDKLFVALRYPVLFGFLIPSGYALLKDGSSKRRQRRARRVAAGFAHGRPERGGPGLLLKFYLHEVLGLRGFILWLAGLAAWILLVLSIFSGIDEGADMQADGSVIMTVSAACVWCISLFYFQGIGSAGVRIFVHRHAGSVAARLGLLLIPHLLFLAPYLVLGMLPGIALGWHAAVIFALTALMSQLYSFFIMLLPGGGALRQFAAFMIGISLFVASALNFFAGALLWILALAHAGGVYADYQPD